MMQRAPQLRREVFLVRTPDLQNQRLPAAARMASDAGLGLEVSGGWPEIPEKYVVVGQKPAPNELVPPKSAIAVSVQALVVVPELRRHRLPQAAEQARALGLELRLGRDWPQDAERWVVLEQRPAPNELVPPKSAIAVSVQSIPEDRRQAEPPGPAPGSASTSPVPPSSGSLAPAPEARSTPEPIPPAKPEPAAQPPRPPRSEPPPPVVVPDVRQRTLVEARTIIAGSQLQLALEEQEPPDADRAVIINQNPAPGARVRVGSRVMVYVAVIPPTVTVPDVRNQRLAEARSQMQAADLELRLGQEMPQTGEVIVVQQVPEPGAVVPARSVVIVQVHAAPAALVCLWGTRICVKPDTPWTWIGGGLAALFIGWRVAASAVRRWRGRTRSPLPSTAYQVRSQVDPGGQELPQDGDLLQGPVVSLRTMSDRGLQEVDGEIGIVAKEASDRAG
jgi:beta-lactam-binding protein with PASTA domain